MKDLGIFDHVDALKLAHPATVEGCFAFIKENESVYSYVPGSGWKNTKQNALAYELMQKMADSGEKGSLTHLIDEPVLGSENHVVADTVILDDEEETPTADEIIDADAETVEDDIETEDADPETEEAEDETIESEDNEKVVDEDGGFSAPVEEGEEGK